jgi:NTE family protein
MPDADDVETCLIEVTFEALPDETERDYFSQLPLAFHLPPDAIDRLHEVAGRLLRQSPEFQRLLRDLREKG